MANIIGVGLGVFALAAMVCIIALVEVPGYAEALARGDAAEARAWLRDAAITAAVAAINIVAIALNLYALAGG